MMKIIKIIKKAKTKEKIKAKKRKIIQKIII